LLLLSWKSETVLRAVVKVLPWRQGKGSEQNPYHRDYSPNLVILKSRNFHSVKQRQGGGWVLLRRKWRKAHPSKAETVDEPQRLPMVVRRDRRFDVINTFLHLVHGRIGASGNPADQILWSGGGDGRVLGFLGCFIDLNISFQITPSVQSMPWPQQLTL